MIQNLFGVDHSVNFNFFLSGLKELTHRETTDDEILYVAGVLAHYSETSRHNGESMPSLADLSEIFDQFFFSKTNDPMLLEIGGSQLLMLVGFFRDQMRHRHNVRWYDEMGQNFYNVASYHSREAKKRELFERMSKSFPHWAMSCCDLSRKCREDRFLLKIN